jgi:prepilin-type N-terminal cleavage/methylation domain-containing protein
VIGPTERQRRREAGKERGFTLVEILVTIVILALVVGGMAEVLITVFRDTGATATHVAGADSAFITDARFADDVAASSPIGTGLPVARASAGCGGDASSLVRFTSTSTVAGQQVQVTSYSINGAALERRTCAGVDLPSALAATPSVSVVVSALATSANPATVQCRATAGALPAPAPPAGDSQCRIVSLTVLTPDGYSFTLQGERSTGTPGVTSPPVLRQCTLVATDDANAYQNFPDRNFDDRDEFENSPGGRNFIENRNASGEIIDGYFRFNLAGPCQGVANGEPAFMPPGKNLASATLKVVFHDHTENNSNVRCTAQDNLDVLAGAWDPATLTWNTSPLVVSPATALEPIRHGFTSLASWIDQPVSVNVLAEVKHWYPAPGGGDWVNNGWVFSDLPNGCDAIDSNKLISKGGDSSLAPQLVLTWVET